jgi:peptide chain release factor 2
MAAPDFWSRPEQARKSIGALKVAKGVVDGWSGLRRQLEEVEVLLQLAEEAGDGDAEREALLAARRLHEEVDALELRSLLPGESDHLGAIVTIHPGAGGTESQDWAEMLLRMYLRWTERRGYEAHLLDLQQADEAGIKDATIEVNGAYAFGYLKSESGVHRLVRISPFDAAKRRHTSFASVFVYPQVDEDIEVEIKDGDLRVDTFRASGAGGQHVNKTESAVRLTHLPTGIVVSSQSERSQHRNRDNAMKILRARLYAHHLEKEREKQSEIESSKKDIAWGSQIRSYVFQPYTLVKDHRTGVETSGVQDVMDGDLDRFIQGYLRAGDGAAGGGR